jgi:hypothetical protein
MQIDVTRDPDDKQLLSIYVRISKGKVHRTIELAEAACYVDVDSRGRPLGFEMIAPGYLEIPKSIKKKLDTETLKGAFKEVEEVVRGLEHFVAA